MHGSSSNNGLNTELPFLSLKKNPDLEGPKLPSYKDILQFFLFHLKLKNSHAVIVEKTYQRLKLFYEKVPNSKTNGA